MTSQNNYCAYVTIKSVDPPIPVGAQGGREERFIVNAAGTVVSGFVRREGGTAEQDVREIDLCFDVTQRQASLITAGCELSVWGAKVSSSNQAVAFKGSTFRAAIGEADTPGPDIYTAEQACTELARRLGEKADESMLRRIIPMSIRKTVVRVQPNGWSLHASAAALEGAQNIGADAYGIV